MKYGKGRIKKIFLMIFVFLVIIFLGIMAVQYKNLKALYLSTQFSQQELETKIDDKKRATESLLKEKYNIVMKDMSLEDEEALRKGKITFQDVAVKYNFGGNSVETSEGSTAGKSDDSNKMQDVDNNKLKTESIDNNSKTTTNTQPSSPTENQKNNHIKAENIIGQKIGSMYSLKAEYISMLGSLESQAMAEYSKIPEEQRTKAAKEKFFYQYMGIAGNMEKQCDVEVERILKDLESELKALGEDTSLVNVLRDSYENEKVLKKSYYMKKFM